MWGIFFAFSVGLNKIMIAKNYPLIKLKTKNG